MNSVATEIAARDAGVTVHCGKLGFTARGAHRRFTLYLEQQADEDGGESLVLSITSTGTGPYRVLVSGVDRGPTEENEPVYCVFVYEPAEGLRPLPGKVLSQLYGLTPAEARLANSLFVGLSLREAAGSIGITQNTARFVLKAVFRKCAVSTQAGLLRLLALGPRTL